jgi:hypothetical protein
MTLGSELVGEVKNIFSSQWTSRDGLKVPESDELKLGNDAVKLSGTVLYADLSQSTAMVRGHKDWFAAEVYKTYLYCAAKIIRSLGGAVGLRWGQSDGRVHWLGEEHYGTKVRTPDPLGSQAHHSTYDERTLSEEHVRAEAGRRH